MRRLSGRPATAACRRAPASSTVHVSSAAMPRRTAQPAPADRALAEARWPATLAIVAAIALYVPLPDSLIVGPTWIFPVLAGALLVPLPLARPHRPPGAAGARRVAGL